jgi:hypothetical protein
MNARTLIANAPCSPAALDVLLKAFDDAWERLAPDVSPEAAEAVRLRLANVVLALARGPLHAKRITEAAVEAMYASPLGLDE